MLHVDLDNIVTDDMALTQLPELLRKADEEHQIIVITRGGKPAVAMMDIAQLETLSGHEVRPAAPVAAEPVVPATPAPASAPLAPLPAVESDLPDMPQI